MTDVSIMYPLDRVEDLTNHNFETFHDGTEVVVAGRIRKDADMESSILMDEISARVSFHLFFFFDDRQYWLSKNRKCGGNADLFRNFSVIQSYE